MSHRSVIGRLTAGVSAAALLLALSAGTAAAQPAPVDPFATHRETGDGFSIRFKDGRSVFQMREPIDIEFVFDGFFTIYWDWDTPGSLWTLDRHDVARPDRAIDGRFDGLGFAFEYYQARPVITRRLNDAVRFDVPGKYRVFVRSRRIIRIGDTSREPETSNILSFQILERDPSFEAGVAARAARILESPGSNRGVKNAAISELRILGTARAAELLARELWRDNDRPNDARR